MHKGLRRATARGVLVAVVIAMAATSPIAQASAIVCATADFDGDGNGDVAASAMREDVEGAVDGGAVNVIYGTGATLDVTNDQYIYGSDQGTSNTPVAANDETLRDPAEAGDFLGSALAAGDFNNDTFCDLAIGAYGENFSGATDAGAVEVVYGSASGLDLTTNEQLTQVVGGSLDHRREGGDYFGRALAVGDFNNDGSDDLAVGVPGENVGSTTNAGAVHVFFGDTVLGLDMADDLYIDANSGADDTEVPNAPESGAEFGSVLAAGDFDNDGDDDLAVGAPRENYTRTNGDSTTTGITDAGAVTVLYSDGTTIDGTDGQFIVQGTLATGVGTLNLVESAESYDRFGSSLAAGDVDGDGLDDLAIGAPLENRGTDGAQYDAGVVHVLTGTATGLEEATFWEQNDTPDSTSDLNEADDKFGAALAIGDFDSTDAGAELAIGAAEENFGATDSGAVELIEDPADPLSATSFWTQNTTGVEDSSESSDMFGAKLAVGNVTGGEDDLLVGVIGERSGSVKLVGQLHVLPGSATAFDTAADSVWSQDTAGIRGGSDSGDQWTIGLDG